jgi:hypothetical protein
LEKVKAGPALLDQQKGEPASFEGSPFAIVECSECVMQRMRMAELKGTLLLLYHHVASIVHASSIRNRRIHKAG